MRTLNDLLSLIVFILALIVFSPLYFTMIFIDHINGKDCDDE